MKPNGKTAIEKVAQKLPTIQDIYSDVQEYQDGDVLTVLLNNQPPKAWVKKHPYLSNWKYLSIARVEFLLKKIFKFYKIEVLKTGMLLNAVEVHVRVHFKNPVTGEWDYHDGVGACEVQTKKDSGPLKMDMTNINKGAITMALPIAKTTAVKDACDHFGKLFGSDLNRKDFIEYSIDEKLQNRKILNDAE